MFPKKFCLTQIKEEVHIDLPPKQFSHTSSPTQTCNIVWAPETGLRSKISVEGQRKIEVMDSVK